jgi:hypothetical protein
VDASSVFLNPLFDILHSLAIFRARPTQSPGYFQKPSS